MLFNSEIFFVFAFLFFTFFYIKNWQLSNRWIIIIVASFIFYGWWNPWYIILILISGCVDFISSHKIHTKRNYAKKYLTLSIVCNLMILISFKYLSFIRENILLIFNISLPEIPIIFQTIPIGISFYTFQSMSYTIDVYRNQVKPTKNILHFFAYLSMFPQLVAGPIVRAKDLLPQLKKKKINLKYEDVYEAIKSISRGFFKKVFIADNLASFINFNFNSYQDPSSSTWWIVMICFSLQIYCDFSGYSDIAIGLARFMGLRFNKNFNHPYVSKSFKEFWSRWHISLSTWFRDYLYIPLGGNKNKYRSYLNLWITMIISGLWHGPSWNFAIWGMLHALYLNLERIGLDFSKIPIKFISQILVYILVLISWVFFRAHDLDQAFYIIKTMLSFNNLEIAKLSDEVKIILFTMIPYNVIILYSSSIKEKFSSKAIMFFKNLEPIFLALLVFITLIFRGDSIEFIYFQF